MKCLFLASGYGGDYFAIEKAREAQLLDIDTIILVSTSKDSVCLIDAEKKGYRTEHLRLSKQRKKDELEKKLLDILSKVNFDVCFLAGFRYIVPEKIVKEHRGKIVNSHHSILPATQDFL